MALGFDPPFFDLENTIVWNSSIVSVKISRGSQVYGACLDRVGWALLLFLDIFTETIETLRRPETTLCFVLVVSHSEQVQGVHVAIAPCAPSAATKIQCLRKDTIAKMRPAI